MRGDDQAELIAEQIEPLLAERNRWRDVRFKDGRLYVTLSDPWTQRGVCARLDLRKYDLEPPKFTVVHPRIRRPLPPRQWPQTTQGRKFVHETLHPRTKQPWCCLEGLWEYHAHYHHEANSWDGIRNAYTLYRIVESVSAQLHGRHPMSGSAV